MVVKDIDRALAKHHKIMDEASAEEVLMNMLKDSGDIGWKTHAEIMDYLLAKAQRLKDTRLTRLKRTLAQFDTAALGLSGHEQLPAVLEKI